MINFIDVSKHNKEILPELIIKLTELVNSGNYILGKNLETFEKCFAEYCGTRHAVGVNSGTDALILSLRSLGKTSGEVLTVSFTFPATIMAIIAAGFTPIYVDVNMTGTMCPIDLEKKITHKTVAIIPVHFMGHLCDMTRINAIADAKGLPIIEDACQSAGGLHAGLKAGSFGYTGCFSFFPTKNLSCLGDGGMITTNNEEVYNKLLKLRNFGRAGREEFESFGVNSRLDEFQAIVLNEKLKTLDQWIKIRRAKAAYYDERIPSNLRIKASIDSISTYHLYVVMVQDNFQTIEQMKNAGVDCRTHYAIPCHKQPFARSEEPLNTTDFLSKHVISLPLSEFISQLEQDKVLEELSTYLYL